MFKRSLSSILSAAGMLFVILPLLAAVPEAHGQDAATTSSPDASATLIDITAPVGSQSGRFGVGMGSSFPAYGLSGTYRVNEQVTAEAILGLMGTVTSVAGRGWYRFKQDPTYDVYGFATAGVYRYGIFDESAFGIGGGVGIELSWAKILDKPDFIPLYSNFDIGLVLANFDRYNFSALSWGGGIHYRFGGN